LARTPPCRLLTTIFLLASALVPLFIPPWLHRGVRNTVGFQVSSFTVRVSMVGIPTEFAWIWPRVLVVVLVGLVGLLFWRDLGFRLRRPFVLLLAGYLALVWLSALLAWEEDWNYRILGGVGRLDGPFYQSGIVLWGVLAYLLFQSCRRVRRLFLATVAGVSALLAILLLAQRAGHDPVGAYLVGGNYPNPVGTIGSPGMAAGLLLLGFFAIGSLIPEADGPKGRRGTWLWLALATLIAAGIGATTNKAATYATLTVLTGLLLVLRGREPLRLLATFLVGAFLVTPLVPDRIGFQRSLADTRTGQTRLVIWKLALESMGKTPGQPFIGAGPDGFLLTLARKIPVSELLKEYRIEYRWPPSAKVTAIRPLYRPDDPVRSRAFMVSLANYPKKGTTKKIIYRYYLDKAHNLFLDRAVSYGTLAALIWLALFLWPLGRFLKRRRKSLADWFLAGGLMALFLYYQVWFPVPQVEPLHVAFLALAWVVAEKRAQSSRHDQLAASPKGTTENPGFGHP